MRSGIANKDRFFAEFDKEYAAKLCQTHLNILMCKKEQFVGNKTLNSALRFVAAALKTTKMRALCANHI